MNRKPVALILVPLVGLFGLISGCSSSETGGQGAAARRVQTGDPPVISITSAPAHASTLNEGRFQLTGQIFADNGLAADEPLVLEVQDLDTGLLTTLDILGLVEGTAGHLQDTSFNLQSGEFAIGGADLLINEGEKALRLIATDSLDLSTTWAIEVTAGPYWEISSTDMGAARGEFYRQTWSAMKAYFTALSALTFEAPFEGESIAGDLQYLDELCSYLDARRQDTVLAHAAEIGWDFEESIDALIDSWESTSDLSEQGYRQGLRNAAGWERSSAEAAQISAVNFQLELFPAEQADWLYRRQALTYLEHTWLQGAWITESPNFETSLGMFEFRIYQDVGTPAGLWVSRLETWTPDLLQPETADPENPALLIQIDFLDQDTDGQVDDIVVGGYEYNPETEADIPIEGVSHYGHTLLPVSRVFTSQYYYPDWP